MGRAPVASSERPYLAHASFEDRRFDVPLVQRRVTVFAVVGDSDTALSLVLRFRSRVSAFVTRVSAGHVVQEE